MFKFKDTKGLYQKASVTLVSPPPPPPDPQSLSVLSYSDLLPPLQQLTLVRSQALHTSR